MRVTHVTTADLDRLEFDAVRSGEHSRVAAQLQDLANRADPASEIPRAELFVRAGEQWEMAQEYERACSAYQRAIDDGGYTVIDPRALCAGAFLQMDEAERAREHLGSLEEEAPEGLPTYLHLAEVFYAHGDFRTAERWATAGARNHPEGGELYGDLLRIRFRIRSDLGLDEDDLDRSV